MAWTKWPTFCRQRFERNFHNWKCYNFDSVPKGVKSLPEQMLAKMHNAIWRHHALMSWGGGGGGGCDVMYLQHYNDVIMGAMASQITSLTVVYSGVDQRKHQSSASLAGNSPVTGESPHKWPVTRKMFPLDDVIMKKPPAFIWYYCSQTICLWSTKQVLLTSRPELRQSLPVI